MALLSGLALTMAAVQRVFHCSERKSRGSLLYPLKNSASTGQCRSLTTEVVTF